MTVIAPKCSDSSTPEAARPIRRSPSLKPRLPNRDWGYRWLCALRNVAWRSLPFCRYGSVAHRGECALLGDCPHNDFEMCAAHWPIQRSEEHTSELQSRGHLVCRLLLEKKKKQ